ncbi:MAG: hypothetical protein ACTSU2_05390 [Promethearchaeota archaeon]
MKRSSYGSTEIEHMITSGTTNMLKITNINLCVSPERTPVPVPFYFDKII